MKRTTNEGTLKRFCWVKEARHTDKNMVQVYLYKMSRKGKSIKAKQDQSLPRLETGTVSDNKKHKIFLRLKCSKFRFELQWHNSVNSLKVIYLQTSVKLFVLKVCFLFKTIQDIVPKRSTTYINILKTKQLYLFLKTI